MAKLKKYKEIRHPNGMTEIVEDGYVLMTEDEVVMLEMNSLLNGDESMALSLMKAEKAELRAKYRTVKDKMDTRFRRMFRLNFVFVYMLLIAIMAAACTSNPVVQASVIMWACATGASFMMHLVLYHNRATRLNRWYDARMNDIRAKYF